MSVSHVSSLPPQAAFKHRAEISIIVEAMLNEYWTMAPSDAVKLEMIAGWIEALEPFTATEVRNACRAWVKGNPNKRPNEGHILGLAQEARGRELAAHPAYRALCEITDDAAQKHGVLAFRLRGQGRDDPTCDARAEAVAMCVEAGISHRVIGQFFGRDHTTIGTAVARHKRNVEARKVYDTKFAAKKMTGENL